MKKINRKKTLFSEYSSGWLLVDLSNSRAKFALAQAEKKLVISHFPTASLSSAALTEIFTDWKIGHAIIASVVPKATLIIEKFLKKAKIPFLFVNASTDLGIQIRYPNPSSIGADRLANVVAATSLYKTPAIVVDFGTGITFDIIDATGAYIGGIIAPGLTTSAEALHQCAALVPLIKPSPIRRALGKNTTTALQSGLLLGARGLVREVVARITEENFSGHQPTIIATGGDAKLVAGNTGLFDFIDMTLTLEGLRQIGQRNLCQDS